MPIRMYQLRRRIAERIGDHWSGTLTHAITAGNATFTLGDRPERQDWFRGGWIQVGWSGSHNKEVLPISRSNVNELLSWILSRAPTMAHNIGDPYEVHTRFEPERYNRAIYDALADAKNEGVLAHLRYESNVWAQGTRRYLLPLNFRYITRVTIVGSDGEDEDVYSADRLHDLKIQLGSPTYLEFPHSRSYTPGLTIRIEGQGDEGLAINEDTSFVWTDESFIVSHAELHLRAVLAAAGGDIGAFNRTQLRELAQQLELKRQSMSTRHRPLPGVLVVP